MHELAAGCGRRGQCAPNRSPSRASVTPCAVGAPSLGLRARLPSPDHLTPCSRTRRRTADGSRTAQIASHGRLTACRSRLTGYPDRAYDRRASPFFRRGALCMLACVVQGSRVHSVGFRTASVRHTSTTLQLRVADHSIRHTLPRAGERMCFGARIVEQCGQTVPGSIFELKPDFDAHLQGFGDST